MKNRFAKKMENESDVRKSRSWLQTVVAPVLMVFYLGALAFLCFGHFDSLPEVSTDFFGIPTDKIVHFCMFFPFPILAYATFVHKTKGRWVSVFQIIGIYIAGCILGILTELGQGLTDYRSCDINDFRADALGMALSSIIIIIIDTIRRSGK